MCSSLLEDLLKPAFESLNQCWIHIRMQHFLLHGTKDPIVNVSYARKLKEIYTDCCYEEIKGAGHGFRGKDDDHACSILTDFMKQV